MPLPIVVCGPLPEVFDLRISAGKVKSGENVYSFVQESPLWPNNSNITVSFLGGTEAQKAIVKAAFAEYCLYADVKLLYVEDNSTDANIRIAFASSQAWSAIGRYALRLEGKPTMDLGSINKEIPSDADRAIALHQVGHALGLGHEWDHGNTQFVKPELKDKALSQGYAERSVSNFPQIDNKSVMSYFLPSWATNDGKGIPANSKLSDSDKAWLVINYPGRFPVSNGVKWDILQALETLKVPLSVVSRILSSKEVLDERAHYAKLISSAWGNQIPIGDETRSNISLQLSSFDFHLPEKLDRLKTGTGTSPGVGIARISPVIRVANTGPGIGVASVSTSAVFGASTDTGTGTGTNTNTSTNTNTNTSTNTNTNTNTSTSTSTSTDIIDKDTTNILAAVILHPNFRETITKLAENDLSNNHGVNLALYPIQSTTGSADVQQGIFGLLVPMLTQLVSQNGIQANTGAAYYPGKPLPPDVQQGIFDVFTTVLKNPIFKNVVTGIVKELIPAVA